MPVYWLGDSSKSVLLWLTGQVVQRLFSSMGSLDLLCDIATRKQNQHCEVTVAEAQIIVGK